MSLLASKHIFEAEQALIESQLILIEYVGFHLEILLLMAARIGN